MKHLNEVVVMTLTLTLEIFLADLKCFFFFCFFFTGCLPAKLCCLCFSELIASDKCCICNHVATKTLDTASIIQENVLSREITPPSSSLPHFSLSVLPHPPSLLPSLSALCASTFHASCHCLSSFLTNEFIKHISVALPKRLDAVQWAKMGGDSFRSFICI